MREAIGRVLRRASARSLWMQAMEVSGVAWVSVGAFEAWEPAGFFVWGVYLILAANMAHGETGARDDAGTG